MKKKVLLISPSPIVEKIHTYPSIALCLIATMLKNNDFDVEIFDGYLDEDYIQKSIDAIDENTIFYGLTVMTNVLADAKKASLAAKQKLPDLPIVWGGNHSSLYSESIMKEDYVDFIVFNEGAHTAIELTKALTNGNNFAEIKGLYYKENGEIKFTGKKTPEEEHPELYPLVDYDMINFDEYAENNIFIKMLTSIDKKQHRSACILTGTGCSYKCTFCINPCLDNDYKELTAEKCYGAMKYYHEKYNVDSFIFIDDNFSSNKDKILELCDLIEKGGETFYWLRICTRANFFGEDKINRTVITRMVNNGVRFIMTGLESGSKRIREGFYKKGISDEELIYSAKISKGLPVAMKYTSIIGAPQEELSDVFKTLAMIMRLKLINPNARFSIFNLVPEPGTKLFSETMPKSVINMDTSVDEFIKLLENYNYYNLNYVENNIDKKKFQICTIYFNLFLLSRQIADQNYIPKSIPPYLTKIAMIPLKPFASILSRFIFYRFRLETTAFPVLYWFLKYFIKFPVETTELIREDGIEIC